MTLNTPVLPAAAIAMIWAAAVAREQRFRSGAAAVRVDVLVTNGKHAVRGLTGEDFEVRDNNVVQRVEQIEVDRLRLNLICVFDTSGSVAGSHLVTLVDTGRALVDALQPADRVALLSFASRIRLQARLTADRSEITRAIGTLEARGTTSLRDAALAGLALRESDPGRTLLLLFSDGADTSSWLPASRVLEAAKHTDVVVYPVALRPSTVPFTTTSPFVVWRPPGNPFGSQTPPKVTITTTISDTFLQSLAEETAGRVMYADSDRDLKQAFVSTLSEFRERYVLTFAPHGVAAGGWHTLTVRLKGRNAKVTARRGYFAQ
jgi:VWFA-related protein